MKLENFNPLEKQNQMLKLLQFGTVMIFLDSRLPGAVVPEHLKNDFQLRLNFDYSYEIDDFRILPDRLEASLSFNKRNFFCVIPYQAIYMMVCHGIQYGALFPESVPSEMISFFPQLSKTKLHSISNSQDEFIQTESTHLQSHPKPAVQALESTQPPPIVQESSESLEQTGTSADKPKRGHLRLIK